MLPIYERGVYNAVFSQVKCRSTRFYSLYRNGKKTSESELVSFASQREQMRIKFGALRGMSQVKRHVAM